MYSSDRPRDGAVILHYLLPKLCTGQNVPGKKEGKTKSEQNTVPCDPMRTAKAARSSHGFPIHSLPRISKADSKSPQLKIPPKSSCPIKQAPRYKHAFITLSHSFSTRILKSSQEEYLLMLIVTID